MTEVRTKAKRLMALSDITQDQLHQICDAIDQLEPSGVSLEKAKAVVRTALLRAIKRGVDSNQINSALLPLNRVMSSILYQDLVQQIGSRKESDGRSRSRSRVSSTEQDAGAAGADGVAGAAGAEGAPEPAETVQTAPAEVEMTNGVRKQHSGTSHETSLNVGESVHSAARMTTGDTAVQPSETPRMSLSKGLRRGGAK